MMRGLIRLTLALSISVPLAAQTPAADSGVANAWTPELAMRFRAVGGTALSADGSLVAYVVREPVMEGKKSEYLSHIWIASADGRTNKQYTRGDKSASNPGFSPDGKWLAFTSSRNDTAQVWVMPVDGGEAEALTKAPAGASSFAWSPDGTRIAYRMTDPESEEEKKAKEEKRHVEVVDADFQFAHLYVIPFEKDAKGNREAVRLTNGDFQVGSFDWAPDGRTIVFDHQPDPRINTGRVDGDISIVDVSTRQVRPLVTAGGVHNNPNFSPDGRSVAFVSTGSQPEPVGLGDVYVVPTSGGSPRKLADTPDRSANVVGWTRDGRSVYVLESVRTERHLIALPADGGAPRNVTEGDGAFGALSLSTDRSHMAFTFETPDTPPDVHVSAIDNFAMRKLTDLHADVARPAMGKTEVLTWRSKDGKFEIDGLLTYPVGYQPGKKVPLLLNVHGGPAGVFSESFTGGPSIYMIQVFAQKGYAVLRPNPRGSTGYGKDFRYANIKDWGYGDFEDLMAGVDHAIEMGVAHPDSLVLAGWSYGGYMTSFGVTQTSRFRAASMGAGLPNLISMTTTTDIPDYLVGHMGGEFWNDYETYEKHSAMYHIAKVTTPTQVIHGERDLRVPFTQGQEFYVALKRKGVPTEMIVLPRTPHGPQEPKLLMAVTPRILSWFEKHLGREKVATQ
jgi:dipeptidyl aminopeptidase/acylaminoacyl peptidase